MAQPKRQQPPLSFGDLSTDANFALQMENLQRTIDTAGGVLEKLCGSTIYSKLAPDAKVKYDQYMSYALSSLYWVYLRTQGVDPNEHQVKAELDRVKGTMARLKKIQDRRTIMPRIDKEAAKRFVRSGLWKPQEKEQDDVEVVEDDKNETDGASSEKKDFGPPNIKKGKKRRFDD